MGSSSCLDLPRSPHYGFQTWLNRPNGEEQHPLFPNRAPESLFAMIGHMGQYVLVSPEQKLTVVRLGHSDAPQRRAMMQQLAEHVDGFAADKNLRAVVVRGNGKDFCHGRDPKGPKGPPPSSAFELHGNVFSKILGVYKAFRACPAPIVSVVQGKALGFGCALVGGSDIAIASDAARFALPEMQHGTAPTLAMSALSKVAPKALANMVYSMDEIDAPTALSVGLVSQVVAGDALDADARRHQRHRRMDWRQTRSTRQDSDAARAADGARRSLHGVVVHQASCAKG